MHGTAGSLENFAANIAAHARHFNCIAFDMIGSGMTDKPDYDYETEHYVKHAVDFLNAMGVEESVGDRSLARRARREPSRHRPPGQWSTNSSCCRRRLIFPAKPIQDDIKRSRSAAAANPTWDNIFEIFKGLFHDPGKVWDDLIATRLAVYRRPDMKTAMPHILALLDPDVYNRNRIPDDDWKRLRAPTLIVAAVDHQDVFLETARTIVKLIPNAKIIEMKHCSHWPQMEDAETFNKLSLEFLGAP